MHGLMMGSTVVLLGPRIIESAFACEAGPHLASYWTILFVAIAVDAGTPRHFGE